MKKSLLLYALVIILISACSKDKIDLGTTADYSSELVGTYKSNNAFAEQAQDVTWIVSKIDINKVSVQEISVDSLVNSTKTTKTLYENVLVIKDASDQKILDFKNSKIDNPNIKVYNGKATSYGNGLVAFINLQTNDGKITLNTRDLVRSGK